MMMVSSSAFYMYVLFQGIFAINTG